MPFKGNYYYYALIEKIPGVRLVELIHSITNPTGRHF
jgi:hypothetical protein